MAKSSEPKYAVCPHCGYQNEKPDGSCGLCIPPEFRAEAARELLPLLLEGWSHEYETCAERAVLIADALIAALRKPPVKE